MVQDGLPCAQLPQCGEVGHLPLVPMVRPARAETVDVSNVTISLEALSGGQNKLALRLAAENRAAVPLAIVASRIFRSRNDYHRGLANEALLAQWLRRADP